MNVLTIDLKKHPEKLVNAIYGGGGGGESGVKSVNFVYPVNGNVSLNLDNIPETETRSFTNIGVKLVEIKTKLDTISEGATKTEKSNINGNIKIDGAEVKVYSSEWKEFN